MLALAQFHRLQFDLQSRGIDFAIVTVVRAIAPTSATLGSQAIVEASGALHGWIGGGCAKGVVIESALAAMESGLPRLVRISNEPSTGAKERGVEVHAMPCASNGTLELFVQPVTMRPGLAVLGGTPAADEVRFLAEHLGVNVGDDATRAPIVLVATQGEGDEAALEAALRGDAAHVLMIASPTKAGRLRESMRARGIAAERVACLQSPVGPDIGAATPAEIALSVMAEVVRLRRRGQVVRPVRATIMADTPICPASYVNPVCGASIKPEQVVHTAMHDGLAQFFCCDHCYVEFMRDPAKYTATARSRTEAVARAITP